MKPGEKSKPGLTSFLVFAPFLKALQDHKADQADNGNKRQDDQDLKRKGYKADKSDQLLEERNDQGDDNEKASTPSSGS